MNYFSKVIFSLVVIGSFSAFAKPGPLQKTDLVGVSAANIVFNQAAAIRAELRGDGVPSPHFFAITYQQLAEIGAHAGVYNVGVQECEIMPMQPCRTAGTLRIWENIFLRPGQAVKTYEYQFIPVR